MLDAVERFVAAAPDVELLDIETELAGARRDARQRKYPRTARVNEVVREVLADELERLSDPRLELVTITGVDVSRDLAHATVYYSTLGARPAADEPATSPTTTPATRCRRRRRTCAASSGARCASGRCRSSTFEADPGIVAGQRIEEILRGIHHGRRAQDEAGADERGMVSELVTRRARRRRRARRAPRHAIGGAPQVALACHVNPDGDALGSMLGAAPRAARRRARRRRVVPEPFVVAPHYRELPGLDLLTPPDRLPDASPR